MRVPVAARGRDARVRAGADPGHVGSTQANLLLPLYGVVAVAALALAWELFGDERALPRARAARLARSRSSSRWEGLTFLWSKDVARRARSSCSSSCSRSACSRSSLARLPWRARWVLTLYVQLAAMALVFAVIGIWQYETRNIFWNPKVNRRQRVRAERLVLPRQLGLLRPVDLRPLPRRSAILASLVVVLFRRGDRSGGRGRADDRRSPGPGCCRRSRSRASSRSRPGSSSARVVALAAGRGLLLVAAARSSCVTSAVAAVSPPVRQGRRSRTSRAAARSSSRRASSSPSTTRCRRRRRRLPARATPTRAPARQGTEGRRVAHDAGDGGGGDRAAGPRCSSRGSSRRPSSLAFRRIVPTFDGAARLAFGLALVAILVHCLFYNALFEDPLFWGLLALVAVAPRARGGAA